ncbi:phosphotransferase [Nonomuraea soli]|uniref:Aminoglycoside phosphotransferase domain-containing protein n=1 Tax=Nonomuraea soli TaxID=1032476 RepID=A0A7W0CLZ4_9ACTN|nr:phosphotransferase [Nonomuraea soli]MBA2893551.1 hypothetical protein [Nonomuraea soli]
MSLRDVVRVCVGDPGAEIAGHHRESLPFAALSTRELLRFSGVTAGGRPWSVMSKTIESMKHAPLLRQIPVEERERAVAHYPWRADADLYLDPPPLPPGLRLPEIYLIEDLGDDRLRIWMEDVEQASDGWDLPRYRRAARLLAELAALSPAGEADLGMRYYLSGPVENACLPALRDPGFWRHPLVASAVDPLLHADLLALADRIPDLLALSERLPHFRAHGDACPQNLLVPSDGSAEFVAIDWSWPYATVIGFDLGQLLVGQANDGLVDPAELPAIHEAILDSYSAIFPDKEVYEGYVASLVLRSAWMALPLDRLGEPPTPELHEFFRRRAGLARFIVDLGRGL